LRKEELACGLALPFWGFGQLWGTGNQPMNPVPTNAMAARSGIRDEVLFRGELAVNWKISHNFRPPSRRSRIALAFLHRSII